MHYWATAGGATSSGGGMVGRDEWRCSADHCGGAAAWRTQPRPVEEITTRLHPFPYPLSIAGVAVRPSGRSGSDAKSCARAGEAGRTHMQEDRR
jgi:hypothetical protein